MADNNRGNRKKIRVQKSNNTIKPSIETDPIVNQKSKSKITELAQRPGFIIINTIVTLFAGATGLISVVDYFQRGPSFILKANDVIIGSWKPGPLYEGKDSITTLFMPVTMINDGNEAFFPERYKLKVDYNGQTLTAIPNRIPRNINLFGEDVWYKMNKPYDRDLLQLEKIDAKDLYNGYILFITSVDRSEIVKPGIMHFKFTCIDVKNKSYSYEFDRVIDSIDALISPNSGIEILPMDSIGSYR